MGKLVNREVTSGKITAQGLSGVRDEHSACTTRQHLEKVGKSGPWVEVARWPYSKAATS